MEKSLKSNIDGYTIIAEGITISDDTHLTQNNRNHLVLGSTGAGKTLSYVLPNILTTTNSFIVSDTKGNLYKKTKEDLKKRGYRVELIDFKNPENSTLGYNPFDYVHTNNKGQVNELDIQRIAACLVDIKDHAKDMYWGFAAQKYCECLIGFACEALPLEERNMKSVYTLGTMILDDRFNMLVHQLGAENPESFSVKRYKGIQQSRDAEKMLASTAGILDVALSKFNASELDYLYNAKKRLNFADIGKKKTAIFLTVSDTDRSLDALLKIFYTQAFDELIKSADKEPDSRLRVPVRLWLDDFATNYTIQDFTSIISNIRSREISCSVICQSMSQLEGRYNHADALTIIDNCDTILYLGGNSLSTAEYLSKRLNKTVDSVLSLPKGKSIVLIRGQKPQIADRYDFKKHLDINY